MTRGARWAWLIAGVILTAVALVLAFVLSFASRGGFYERHFVWLVWVNGAVALLLVVVLAYVAARLLLRLRHGKFGSRLLVKLAGIFALVGLLPGLVIYAISYQFAARSIESWFDERLASALDAGLALGRGTLETGAAELLVKARAAALRLEDWAPASPLSVERLREQLGVRQASVHSANGQLLLSATDSARTAIERPSATMLLQARGSGVASQVEGLDEESLAGGAEGARLRALVRLPERSISLAGTETRYLMVVQALPRAFAANALAVQNAYAEYQQRAIARDALRQMYVGTLTLALMLAVFGAVLLAIVLGNQLARPLLLLADGVRQVAAGNYAARPVFPSGDELGGLTRSFAAMTTQVAEAREQVQRGMAQLEAARLRLQTILDTLTPGVIVFDREGRIDAVNPGAARILQQPLADYRGRKLSEVGGFEAFGAEVEKRFALLASSPELGERDRWQHSFELARDDGALLSLLVRGAMLPAEAMLMVFDDVSEVASAQRSAAWTEVARRLAHEIKNPLTPIQLSAERLLARLAPKLEGAELALLQRSVNTIVVQVAAMQKLVNEFRDYARLPAAQLQPLDLNALVHEVLGLYGQALDNGLLVTALEGTLPPILGDATQLRQVIHNLVQNALDAVADRPDGLVELHTASAREEKTGALAAVRLTVVDNGPGFAERVLKRAFEPYVTTKSKGTGLGLAVVKKVADEHGARVGVANLHAGDEPDAPVTGARVSLSFSKFPPTRAKPGPEGTAAPAAVAATAAPVTTATPTTDRAVATTIGGADASQR